MIETFLFLRLGWKLRKCCKGWEEVMETWSRIAHILEKGSQKFI